MEMHFVIVRKLIHKHSKTCMRISGELISIAKMKLYFL